MEFVVQNTQNFTESNIVILFIKAILRKSIEQLAFVLTKNVQYWAF